MSNITWEDILKVCAIVAAVCGFLWALYQGVSAFKKLSHADEKEARLKSMETTIAELNKRVSECDGQIALLKLRLSEYSEDMSQVLNVLNAMLMHFISGNDKEKLRIVKGELDKYQAQR